MVLIACALLQSCNAKNYYSARDFGIVTVKSSVDYNGNGRDDYTDFVLGARRDAKNKPKYDDSYYEGGYPPDDIGVCADVIWRAFRHAGYSLRVHKYADCGKNFGMRAYIIRPIIVIIGVSFTVL